MPSSVESLLAPTSRMRTCVTAPVPLGQNSAHDIAAELPIDRPATEQELDA